MTTETTSSHVERFPDIGPIAFFQALWETRNDPLARLILRRIKLYFLLPVAFALATYGIWATQGAAVSYWMKNRPLGGPLPAWLTISSILSSLLNSGLQFLVLPMAAILVVWRNSLGRDVSLRLCRFTPGQILFAFLLPVILATLIYDSVGIAFWAHFMVNAPPPTPAMTWEARARQFLFYLVVQMIPLLGHMFVFAAIAVRYLTFHRFAGTGRNWKGLVLPCLAFLIPAGAIQTAAQYATIWLFNILRPGSTDAIYSLAFSMISLLMALIYFYIARYFWRRDFPIVANHTFGPREEG
ncbi:hypothetical protein KQI84_16750 [bacterium]|nr:hypothetical protein [bacterium]